jgi:cephalosporin hydroxylase
LSDTRRILRLIQIGKYSIVIDNVIRGPLMKTEWLLGVINGPRTSKKKFLSPLDDKYGEVIRRKIETRFTRHL